MSVDKFSSSINRYKLLLIEANKLLNLYSSHSLNHIDFHIQDSINIADMVQDGALHVDLGSGAGLPGVIVAIVSNATVICVESKAKKRRFLIKVKEALNLENLEVFDGDVQLFASQFSGKLIRSLSAKAFAKPPKLIWYLSKLNHCCMQDTECIVPVSKGQKMHLGYTNEIKTVITNKSEFYYFRIPMKDLLYYKVDLEKRYNL